LRSIYKKPVLFITLLVLYLTPAFAEQEVIVLQNGLNGYSGCEDTYLRARIKNGSGEVEAGLCDSNFAEDTVVLCGYDWE
jgi:hypothetical protein